MESLWQGSVAIKPWGNWVHGSLDTCWKALCILIMAGVLILALKGNLMFFPNKQTKKSFSSFFLLRHSWGTKWVQPRLGFAMRNKGWFSCFVLRALVLVPAFGMMDMSLTTVHWWILIPENWWGARAWVACGISSAALSQFNWLLEVCLARKAEQVLIRFGL